MKNEIAPVEIGPAEIEAFDLLCKQYEEAERKSQDAFAEAEKYREEVVIPAKRRWEELSLISRQKHEKDMGIQDDVMNAGKALEEWEKVQGKHANLLIKSSEALKEPDNFLPRLYGILLDNYPDEWKLRIKELIESVQRRSSIVFKKPDGAEKTEKVFSTPAGEDYIPSNSEKPEVTIQTTTSEKREQQRRDQISKVRESLGIPPEPSNRDKKPERMNWAA